MIPLRFKKVINIIIALILMGLFLLVIRYLNSDINLYKSPIEEQSQADEGTTNSYMNAKSESINRLSILNSYFRAGFVKHKTESCSYVNYPGYGSIWGFRVSGMEGFSRTGVLIASEVFSKLRDGTLNGNDVKIINCLKNGILNGTGADSKDYWGSIEDYDQRVVESADIARILWLTKPLIWDTFSSQEKKQVAQYLLQVNHVKLPQNNWLLFPVVVNTILSKMNVVITGDPMKNYFIFKKFYLSDGWFFDAPHGVDFYNTWGITYDLFWIHYVNDSFDKVFITKAINDSANLTEHLISPVGIPMMGRSVCYRMAVPAPLLANSLITNNPEVQAKAKHGFFLVLDHFVSHKVLIDGTITQGFYNNDKRFLDIYSGPGSCHWSLRSLVLANLHSLSSSFWVNPGQKLPIEIDDFSIDKPSLGWLISGDEATKKITITLTKNDPDSTIEIKDYSFKDRLKDVIGLRIHRPDNDEIKYHQYIYTTDNNYLRKCSQKSVDCL